MRSPSKWLQGCRLHHLRTSSEIRNFFFLFCIFFFWIDWILSSPFSLLICADRRLLSSTAGTACKELLVRLTRMEEEGGKNLGQDRQR